jgi:hypothetical protein
MTVQERLAGVFTPLNLPQTEAMLDKHPDRSYVDFILGGIKDGFCIGYCPPAEGSSLLSARKNMQSV